MKIVTVKELGKILKAKLFMPKRDWSLFLQDSHTSSKKASLTQKRFLYRIFSL